MATDGLSLVGFLDQTPAINYLKFSCKPDNANATDADLIVEWNAAQAKLGALYTNAGNPDIQQVPDSHSSSREDIKKAFKLMTRSVLALESGRLKRGAVSRLGGKRALLSAKGLVT